MMKYIWEEHIKLVIGALWYHCFDYYMIKAPVGEIGCDFKRRLKIWRLFEI